MTQGSKKSGSVVDNVRGAVSKNPAAERLVGELESYARNRMLGLVDSIGDRIGDATDRLEDFASNGGPVKKAAKNAAQGDSPLKAGAKALGSTVKDKLGGLLDGKGGGGNSTKATLIEETIDVGVPVSVAYNQWTQFQEFGRFTKGVQSVSQNDDATTTWKAKVAFSTRSWKAEIKEQIPDEKIAWTADGDKGSVNGVVTFHELAPNLTRVLLELEYHPKGLMEKTGNLWRAQGRRARLDLKNFRWYVMSQGEESGAWRGEIHDGEVTQDSDEGDRSSRGGRGRRQEGSSGRKTGRRRQPREEQSRSDRDRRRGRSSGNRSERRVRTSSRERSTPGETSDQTESRGREERSQRRRSSSRRRSGQRAESESPDTGGGAEEGGSDGGAGNGNQKSAARKSTPRKTTARKSTARKSTPRKSTARKSTARKSTARKSTPRKSTARKSTPRKSTSAQSADDSSSAGTSSNGARKTTAARAATPRRKATAARKRAPAKSTAKKTTRRAAKKTAKKTTTRKSASARKSTPRRKSTPARKRSGSR